MNENNKKNLNYNINVPPSNISENKQTIYNKNETTTEESDRVAL